MNVMVSTDVSDWSKLGDCSFQSQSKFGCCSCNSSSSCNAYGFLSCSQLPLRKMEVQWWQDCEAASRGNFLRMFVVVCCFFLKKPLVSSRNKYWMLGKKYAVNLRWPAAAAELQNDLAYFPQVCNHALGRPLQELSYLFGKNTVPSCCLSPAG